MSRFLSPKFLRYRAAIEGGPVDEDRYCKQCGYNLRGLPFGRNCPECGQSPIAEVGDAHSRGRHDAILSGDEAARHLWKIGLGLASLCIAVALISRLGYMLLGGVSVAKPIATAYVTLGAINSVLWIVAVFIITPAALDARWPWMGPMRLAVRLLSFMWIVGYACKLGALLSAAATTPMAVMYGNLGGRLLAAFGVLIMAVMLSHVASDAELTETERDLRRAVWLLPITTPIAHVLGLLAFPALAAAIFPLIPYVAALVFWLWSMLLLFSGFWQLYQHARWAEIHAIEARDRPERIIRKRKEMDKEVEGTIRALPVKDEREIGVEGPRTGGRR